MKLIQKISLAIATLVTLFVLAPNLAFADTKSAIQCGANAAASGDCNSSPSGSLDNTVAVIINILSAIVGIVAVVMIIVAGLRFVTSAGNQEGTKSARNTILYSVIGLVIVALAQVITHFVIHTATSNPIPPVTPTTSTTTNSPTCPEGSNAACLTK